MSSLKEKEVLERLDLMLTNRSDLKNSFGLATMGLTFILPYLWIIIGPTSFVYDIIKKLMIMVSDVTTGIIAATLTLVCCLAISLFLNWLVYFRRTFRKKREAFQKFCRENKDTILEVLFSEEWLEQRRVEREEIYNRAQEIYNRAHAVLRELDEIVDPVKARAIKKQFQLMAWQHYKLR
jgi:hypothetical protein